MKKKLFLLPILATMLLAMTSCDIFGGLFDKHNNVPEVIPDAQGLLVYNNDNQARVPFSGGGLYNQYDGAKDADIKLNYDRFGDVNPGLIDYMPSTGHVNILVIPCYFSNYKNGANDENRNEIYHAFFGTPADTGFESVTSYFAKSSFNALQIGGVVSEWYNLGYTYQEVQTGDQTAFLVGQAFEWYKKKYNTNGAEFDADNDGYVDAICLIYNAKQNFGRNDNLWAYCYWRQVASGSAKAPVANSFMWASMCFKDNPYDHNISIDAHTYIHELGHIMGLEDYYNTYQPDHNVGSTGGYIMQDNNVGDHDPFSKIAFNWVRPTIVSKSTTIPLSSFTDSGQVLIFKPDYNDFTSPFDEYLAVELYTPTGLNKHDSDNLHQIGYPVGPKKPGLRIWHVDARLLKMHGDQHGNAVLDEITNTYSESYRYAYMLACSNSQRGPHASLDPELRSFRLLQSIQKGKVDTYSKGALIKQDDLFMEGDSFSMDEYSNYFINNGNFNSGKAFDVTIKVKSIKDNKATIEVVM